VSARTQEQVILFGCVVVAIILHEISHGVVALWFGDDTAKRARRLTLNPIRHIDLFGSIILPAMMTLAGQGAFGWAKPVPVNPSKLRNPRREMVFVGLAGPVTNFLLMAVAAVACRVTFQRWLTDNPVRRVIGFGLTDTPLVVQVLFYFALANLLLGIFNLLPIPPLDGFELVRSVLRRSNPGLLFRIETNRQQIYLVVLLVFLFAPQILFFVIDFIVNPVATILGVPLNYPCP
jgi:Zn-dependent protease